MPLAGSKGARSFERTYFKVSSPAPSSAPDSPSAKLLLLLP